MAEHAHNESKSTMASEHAYHEYKPTKTSEHAHMVLIASNFAKLSCVASQNVRHVRACMLITGADSQGACRCK